MKKYKIKYIKETNIFSFHYNYGLDWFFNNENNLNFDKLYHKNDDYNTPILLQPNKAKNTIQISNIDYLATRDILNFVIHKHVSFDFIDKFFTPTKCKLKIKTHNIIKYKNDDESFTHAATLSSKLDEIINPYYDDFDTEATFSVGIKSLGGVKNDIELEVDLKSDNDKCKASIERFQLDKIYKKHSDIAKGIWNKAQVYNEDRIEELYESFYKNLGYSKEEVKNFVFCNYLHVKDINKRNHSKLTQDILKQFNLYM